MSSEPLRIVFLGLSITSSWGNGHATTYRSLVRALSERGHDVLFLERDVPWYAANRDLPAPPWGRTRLYPDLPALRRDHSSAVRDADLVVVGSYVPDGVEVGRWVQAEARGVTAFYDIDTPVTLARLARGDEEYLTPELIPGYDLYLSFTGGPTLRRLEDELRAPHARPLYCSVDPDAYRPVERDTPWTLGYLGTYSLDRQPKVEELLLEPARRRPHERFVVAGPQYPPDLVWPQNVEHLEHLPPPEHSHFYSGQRFTLNVTRADMVAAGYSPSIRLFEAAACEAPVISDAWPGLEEFFTPGEEVLVAADAQDVVAYLDMAEPERRRVAGAARRRVLAEHTPAARARALEGYVAEVAAARVR